MTSDINPRNQEEMLEKSKIVFQEIMENLAPWIDNRKLKVEKDNSPSNIVFTNDYYLKKKNKGTRFSIGYDLNSGNPPGEICYSRILMPYKQGNQNPYNWRFASRLWNSLEYNLRPLGLDSVPTLDQTMKQFPGIQIYRCFKFDQWQEVMEGIMFADKVIETKLMHPRK